MRYGAQFDDFVQQGFDEWQPSTTRSERPRHRIGYPQNRLALALTVVEH